MQELSFVSSDGEYAILRAADGTDYRVLLDEELRSAARRDSISESDSALISPREIQMQVRAGASPADLVSITGASREYIEKFALPVIDELQHVVNRALSVRLTMAGDRYQETTQVEFGEVIGGRLAQMGVHDFSWSSRKGEHTGWELHCHFGDNQASWSFDPRALTLAPDNELAVQLSNQTSNSDSPVPKLRPVTNKPKVEPEVAPAAIPAVPIPEEPDVAQPATTNSGITEDLGSTLEFHGVVPFGRSKPATQDSEPVQDLANTADLLDALRKRRAQRERELNEAAAIAREQDEAAEDMDINTAPIGLIRDEAEPVTQEVETVAEVEPEAPEETKPKKGRTTMPSWDEIVFGTRNDED